MLFVHDKLCLARSFAVQSKFIDVGRKAELESWDLGLELTRPARAMRLWFVPRALGTQRIGEMIDHGVHMVEEVEAVLRARPHWEIESPAQMAILVLRFEPDGHTESEISRLNERIADVALQENVAFIRTILFEGQTAMGMCIIHPRLTTVQMVATIDALDKIAIRLSF